MGGGQRSEEDEWFRAHPEFAPADRQSKFVPGGGTFRDRNVDPKFEHPVLRSPTVQHQARHVGDMFGRNLLENPQKVYDMEALRRLVELLNQDRERKPYGIPDNANIGF